VEQVGFQFVARWTLIKKFNIELILGIDGISMCFLILTSFIMVLCWFAALQIRVRYREFVLCLLLIEIFLLLSFTMLDLFFFYVFFESVLIPMFIIIGFWGSRERKIRAAYYFFFIPCLDLFLCFLVFYIFIRLPGQHHLKYYYIPNLQLINNISYGSVFFYRLL